MAPSSSRRKQAASQAAAPQRTPPPPPGSRTTPRARDIPENSQVNSMEDYPITFEESEDEVNFIEENDIRINKDEDFSSPTNIPPNRESFILASILPPNYPLIDYKVALLAT
jgi:hypothetical protein